MKSFKDIFETTYMPKGGDERVFWNKHIVDKKDNPNAAPGQFTSDKKKVKRKADYDEGDDKAVYEAAEVHTKRADKEAVIVRAVDPKTGQSKAKVVKRAAGEIKIGEEVEELGELSKDTLHSYTRKAVPDFLKTQKSAEKLKVTPKNTDKIIKAAVKLRNRRTGVNLATKKMSEEVELDEKVVNPYAVGMAAAMKQAGDTPPLKKSTIVKGHEIAKSIKKEALDPVGKHDADIDNDGDTDKSDKYLIKRRKAISRAVNEAVEVRHDRYMGAHGKKARDTGQSGNWMFTHKSKGDVDYNDEKEVHSTRGKFADAKKSAQTWAKKHGHSSVYVMEEVELDEGHGVFLKGGSVGETRSGKPVEVHSNIEDAKAQAKRLNKNLSPGEKKHYGLKYHVKPVSEEVDQIDEAFKVGAMHLEDGSSITLTREDVNVLNGLFGQLNAANKTKMEQRLKSSKNGFNEIITFAKEVV